MRPANREWHKQRCIGGTKEVKPQHTRGEGLLELVGLLLVVEDEGVEVAAATNLELDLAGRLLNLDRCGGNGKGEYERLAGCLCEEKSGTIRFEHVSSKT